jgi:hypothetical protein
MLDFNNLDDNIHTWLSIGLSGNRFIQQGSQLGNLDGIVTYTAMQLINQERSNQSEDSNPSINQFNPNVSKYPINQVRALEVLRLIDSKSVGEAKASSPTKKGWPVTRSRKSDSSGIDTSISVSYLPSTQNSLSGNSHSERGCFIATQQAHTSGIWKWNFPSFS